MKFIDKKNKKNRFLGDSIINEFIKNQRVKNKECKYFLLVNTPYKNKLRNFLIKEQQEKCCYCMRKLKYNDSTTIEHIIPKSAMESCVNNYLNYNKGIFHFVKYENNLKKFAYPPYPHQIAYGNLCASCKGFLHEDLKVSRCCNNKRGEKLITPIIFLKDIEKRIEYLKTGSIHPIDTDLEDTILILGLNTETLIEIRTLWALVAKHRSMKLTKQNKQYELLSKIFKLNSVEKLKNSQYKRFSKYFEITNKYYWELFKEYKWFYSYYRYKM